MYGYGYRYSTKPNSGSLGGVSAPTPSLLMDASTSTTLQSRLGTGFNGVDSSLNIDAVLNDLNTSTGIWCGWYLPVDGTPTSPETIASFGDTNANTHISLQIDTAGKCRVIGFDAGVQKLWIETNAAAFTTGVYTHILAKQDGTNVTLYIDGSAVAQTDTSNDATYWIGDIALLDNGRLGSLNQNSSGGQAFAEGSFDEWSFYDNDTAITATDSYNSGSGLNYYDLSTAQKVGLKAYYPLNSLTDLSGNSNTAVNVGTPVQKLGKVLNPIADAEKVDRWISNESNAYVFDQPTYTKQPVYHASGFGTNSKPYIEFDGSTILQHLTALFTSDEQGTLFIVAKSTNITANQNTLSSADSAVNTEYINHKLRLVTGSVYWSNNYYTTMSVYGNTNVGGSEMIGVSSSNGSAVALRANGVAQTLSDWAGSNGGQWWADIVGADNMAIGGTLKSVIVYSEIDIAEIRYFNTDLTTAEKEAIELELNTKYGVY